MPRERASAICRELPGAEWSDPRCGGQDAWKVGGKMFARIGMADDGVSVKTPDIETATMPNEVGVAPARALLPPQLGAPALGHRP
jgi:predicted DNA-binding protein (MmcQ/YjbR family)